MKRIYIIVVTLLLTTIGQAQHTGHDHHPKPVKAKPAQKQATPAKAKAKSAAKPKVSTQSATDSTHQGHQGHPHPQTPAAPASTTTPQPAAAPPQNHSGHDHGSMNPSDTAAGTNDDMPAMTHSFSRNLPMTRNGSGTSWQPDATPMYAYMKHAANWNFMVHGAIFPRYTSQDIFNAGTRGDSKFGSPNWFMVMAQREVGKRGLFSSHVMVSFDILTEGGAGYPLLFQSGETFNDKPLIDRQHPHDLFSEVSVGYTHMLNQDMDIFGYFGFPGEPALGPPAFMHRISAYSNPDATLGHHWQDATHIVFGVGTLGFRYKNLKLEGSRFTGREPNENRYNFDKPTFDSYSYRITANPSDRFSLQFSQGFIKSPEVFSPEEDVNRTTASVLYSNPLNSNNHFTSALVWGLNKGSGDDHHVEHSALAEANLQLNKTSLYGRTEFIQKSAHELAIPETGDHEHEEIYNVGALTLGASRVFAQRFNTDFAIGLQGTVYSPEKAIQNVYGKVPVSGQIYLRITPGLMQMGNATNTGHGAHSH